MDVEVEESVEAYAADELLEHAVGSLGGEPRYGREL